ncbi:hypothetical protein H634G_11616 [Metarhizium anisopliae BRIP 53293]|uniref:Uncharacterized protein n=1 Tax=Metarhizium anisopliae BRIP 53293 TaxID=1291518 RepID=A0A0D9NH40_METAN|nr:hypothetical protein H634G_11616 [Metarhizium anisopliae BRIP 53293]
MGHKREWVPNSRVLPNAVHRMTAISNGQFRIFKALSPFKKQWREEACKAVHPDKLKEYHKNPVSWEIDATMYIVS